MMDYIIKNVTAVTMDDENPVISNAFIGINGAKIAFVSRCEPRIAAKNYIDGRGKVAMPGLINTHTHLGMTIMRGYADGYNLQTWLNDYVFPAERKLDERCVELSSLWGLAESIRCGTTSVSDMYMYLDGVARAADSAGVCANLSNAYVAFDKENYDFEKDGVTAQNNRALSTWHNKDDGRLRLDAAIHGEYTSFDGLWRKAAAYAAKNRLNMQLHLSETELEHRECVARNGKTPAEVFCAAGVFDVPTTAAHCVYVTPEDMEILAKKGVTVAHNPISNLKLASGIAKTDEMLEKAINVSLGTDGVCSNNSHDMFEEIKFSALLQKGMLLDPTAIKAFQALKMATVNGALAQGRQKECGKLAEGFDASIILVDFNNIGLFPVHSEISSLCYSAKGSDVCFNMVRGRVLYENGEYKTIDIEKLKHEITTYVMPRIFGEKL